MSTKDPLKDSPTAFANKVTELRQEVCRIEAVIKEQQDLLFEVRQKLSREIMKSLKHDDSPSP